MTPDELQSWSSSKLFTFIQMGMISGGIAQQYGSRTWTTTTTTTTSFHYSRKTSNSSREVDATELGWGNKCKVPRFMVLSCQNSHRCTIILFGIHAFKMLRSYQDCLYQPHINKQRAQNNYFHLSKGATKSNIPICQWDRAENHWSDLSESLYHLGYGGS